MKSITKIIDKKIFLTAFFATIIIHGEKLFNVFAWHDDASAVFSGWNDGLHHGRWLHFLMAEVTEKLAGLEATPVIIGSIVAVCIGLMACVLFNLFEITEYYMQFPLILIFCAIPAVTGHFGYMGAAGYDFIGKLLCVISSYVFCKGLEEKKGIKSVLFAVFLLACSLGEYQCYLTFYLSILLLYFTQKVIQENITWKDFWTNAFFYVGSALVGLVLYLGILQILLYVFGEQLTSYAGTDTYGMVNLSEYVQRIVFAYKDFFKPDIGASYNMFPFHRGELHAGLILGIFGLAFLILLSKIIRRQYRSAMQYLITFVLVPLGFNFNFVLYGVGPTHSLHMYHIVLLFVYLFVLAKAVVTEWPLIINKEKLAQMFSKIVHGLVVAVVFLFGVLYARYDNYCYMQTEIRQEEAISYYTTLITRIQSAKGYDDEYPVVFVNGDQKKNSVDTIDNYFDPIVTNPYNYPMVNSYNWYDFMTLWCGYEPETADASIYEENENVQDMPSYPDEGSIQIIDKVVIVKF